MAVYSDNLMVFVNGKLVKISSSDSISLTGGITAGSFTGSASGLTAIPSGQLTGALPAIDGSALTSLSSSALSGALPALDGSALTSLSSSSLVGALPALDGSALTSLTAGNLVGNLPAIDGSLVTGLNADHLATGTVDSGRISGSYGNITGVGTLTSGAIGSGFTAIDDTHLATISSSGKVSNSATTATDLNTASAIVARDSAGNFSAGIISAALSGNASTSTKWASAISIGFAGGDVTGSISSLDGSGSVANVALSIGSGVVTNGMLAGSISDDKLLQISSAGKVADSALSSNVALYDAATAAFQNNVTIGGSLQVTGTITSGGEINSTVADAFLTLANGNVGTSALAGGLSVNLKKATGFTAETATAFVAGVLSTSLPSMTIASSSLSAGDIVQVSGTAAGKNDGLYVIDSVSGSDVFIKGIGGTGSHFPASYVPFVHNQFEAQTAQTASVVKVDLAVFAVSNGSLSSAAGAIAAGVWCYAYAASAVESDFATGYTGITSVVQSLQAAYEGGASIQLAGGSDLVVSAPLSGNAAVSLEANAASQFAVAGANLSLKTTSSGDVVLDAAGVIDAKSKIMLGDSVGFVQSVAAGVGDFELCYIDSSGVAQKISSAMEQELDCVVLEGNGGVSPADKQVASVVGAKVKVAVTGSASIGDILYVSATAGSATATVPTSGRIIKVGKVVGAASGSHYPVIYLPQYIADI